MEQKSRDTLLRLCGEACADSYTRDIFKREKRKSSNMDEFLKNLSVKFPDARYEIVSSSCIRVMYKRCGCDIVGEGLISDPLFCRCSAANLKANFKAALGRKIEVDLKESILGGADRCLFLVRIMP